MRLKTQPEDFRVDELVEWKQDPRGTHAIYKIEKRKLTTFEAMRMIAAASRVPLDRLSYVGLKDRQGITTQFVSVEGQELRGRIQGIHYQLVGRAKEALASENLIGNDFSIVVRDLSPADAKDLALRVSAVAKHGLPHYFDDQRFGSLAAGQGFPARELVRGDPEGALKLLIATPGKRDPEPEKKFKFMVQKMWGEWDQLARRWSNRPGVSIVRHLKRKPTDFVGAWSHMPGKERAIHVFAYQSFIWNDAVARFLRRALPKTKLVEASSVAGRIPFWTYGAHEEMPKLPASFPLIDDATPITDERIASAIDEALKAEGLTRASFKIQGVASSFFKFEWRPLTLKPERLVISRPPFPDDRHPGRLAVGLSFRLPPGGYATLVVKRLFPGSSEDVFDTERARKARVARKGAHGPSEEPSRSFPRRDAPRRAPPTGAPKGPPRGKSGRRGRA